MSFTPEFATIAALRQALQNKTVSARELAQQALDNSARQKELNAFVQQDAALTLAQADAADALIAQGKAGPLTGIPIAHKDLFVTKDWQTTACSKMLEGYVSPFDATVVTKLQAAGAVSLGKLNCDEFAMGSRNESSVFGPVRNPWDHSMVPGGSSGGSAAAVAAGLVAGATATDTGGSIRQPAALCGVSGIKPTYGTISRFGIIAYGSSLDQAGPIARNARDLLDLLENMCGFDPQDATSLEFCDDQPNNGARIRQQFEQQQAQQEAQGSQPLKGLRIGVPAQFFGPGLDPVVADAIEAALKTYESLGAERVTVQLPLTELSVPTYYVISPAEASTNLSRFDGVRFGHRASQYTDLNSMISRSRSEGFGPEVVRRILVGTYVLSHGYYDAYYLQAQRVRRMIVDDFQKVFEQCDLILGPVTPALGRKLGATIEDPTTDWLGDVYTLGVSLAGLPAMSIPCGFSKDERPLPIGLQIIGNYFREGQLLAFADRFQQVTDWHQRQPGQQ
ncbi:Asp-tRNA(Asn)/Glu-tRNA(Gln) amidotransferase subunit GatA [Alcaligenes phenolicus]|jgi:aspartyl-tRNA(Asn)/glutamyl-tRNA(Gln) amidotransferase subunit A|uniref:Glutamyl-tRNA(Gln) amidotransferase subunit A n=2 Tax=Alcaligenes TaxID=507 RepID=A0AAE9HD08_ALCFA|nr:MULTISPECIES: Asp-tRNA(Asn)/Glu-tRNA(Gln) amidotransferase subunit GatA [Alcaligenes]KGP02281.1 glutamyl-tRNA amidotransferase [Alcaligenes faecalis]MCB4324010.1 Asp-tRNA(Asn)/Glu-tRNA(Gln) amidotransferase subunit GatA [Alcaligenes sp. 13f]OQV29969.1 aspartyl/glutamyl-tRNA amidotransferase subunit A [Alcaligenes phenolicus]QCP81568.1 Asp-tRNA(Asn)/Glu-tRNA(Gln) amidotransferase subunit GatA [Alcaligenes faecalis]UPL22016.1 Asp-tRNA(Asn)/Glu-tRNA(Gln) amidotransferase subunit GatA [Alcalige